MIKQLQLRGISRTPSDRMTADGGCAESLNIHLEDGESAPTIPAKDISEDYDFNGNGSPIFIHKGYTYENLIFTRPEGANISLMALTKGGSRGELDVLDGARENLEILDIAAIGNTLVIATQTGIEYSLFKDGQYVYLGDRIPIPKVELQNIPTKATPYQRQHVASPGMLWGGERSGSMDLLDFFNNAILTEALYPDYKEESWEKSVAEREQIVRNWVNINRVFTMDGTRYALLPIFFRFAVRLYDGTYCYQSDPILMHNGKGDFPYSIWGNTTVASGSTSVRFQPHYTGTYYSAKAILHSWKDAAKWNDIVKGIDFFSTGFINILDEDVKFISVTNPESNKYQINLSSETDETYAENHIAKASGGPYFKFMSYDIGNTKELENGVNLFSHAELFSGERLVTNQQLDEGYLPFHKNHADNINTYNNRLLLSGISTQLPKGSPYNLSPAVVLGDNAASAASANPPASPLITAYRFRWLCRKGGLTYSAISDYVPGYEGTYSWIDHNGSRKFAAGVSIIKGWLSYPDPNCYRVEVEVVEGQGSVGSVSSFAHDMQTNPNISYSYAFWGLGNEISTSSGWEELNYYTLTLTPSAAQGVNDEDIRWVLMDYAEKTLEEADQIIAKIHNDEDAVVLTTSDADFKNFVKDIFEAVIGVILTVSSDSGFSEDENPIYSQANLLLLSESSNPFLFPADGNYTFYSNILNTAAITTPLSQGQFGQFPLYVFTEDGIWAMETAADGKFLSSKPISRDVCINGKSIMPIEQAVIFISDKGVMMVQGSQVTNLSENMNGRHYVLETDVRNLLLTDSAWSGLLDAVNDNTPFMAFMKNAEIAYDYKGGRLICFNDSKSYQYVYMFGTQTWHKQLSGSGAFTALNSYPDCLVTTSHGEKTFTITSISASEAAAMTKAQVEALAEELVGQYVTGTVDLGTLPQSFIMTEAKAYLLAGDIEAGQIDDAVEYQTTDVNIAKLLDYSTVLDNADLLSNTSNPVKGMIVTRPFDLGAPDVRKTIKSIRIRGQYNLNDVKYILCGSMNGINWQRLTSLRGGSYKLFRLVVLANLSPTERISWIDVDFDTRFTNKLR